MLIRLITNVCTVKTLQRLRFFFYRISDQVLLLQNAQFFRFLKFGNAHNFYFMLLLLQVSDFLY